MSADEKVPAPEWAVRIAAELGKGWRAMGDGNDRGGQREAWLHGPRQAVLHAHGSDSGRDRNGKRLHIEGVLLYGLTKHGDYNAKHHEMSVTAAKTPRQIAAEIQRRLLPEYLPYLATVQQRKVEHDADVARREALLVRLTALWGDRACRPSHVQDEVYLYGGAGRGKARVLSSTVEFKVEVPHGQAEALTEFLRRLDEAAPAHTKGQWIWNSESRAHSR